jgi:hypothetical protein
MIATIVRRFRSLSTLFAVIASLAASGSAAGQLRVVSYNIAQTLGDAEALGEVIAALHADDKPGFATPVSVFIFQEVRSADLPIIASLIHQHAPQGASYVQGSYTNGNEDDFAGAQAMFYRSGLLVENATQHAGIWTGAGRFARRWRLNLAGYDSPLAGFYIYSMHLKASSGGANELLRLQGVQNVRANADQFPAETHVIYGGDMNFYHNQESGYLMWFQPGNGRAAPDPLGSTPWGGPGNAIKHSQSPRLVHQGGLVGGGMNQRFDFLLHTLPFADGQGFSIIPGTYRSFGNDGMHFNQAINDGNNLYYPDDIPRSNALADNLHDASDHIPVIVEYQIPARMAVNVPANYGKVIQGADFDVTFTVSNTAPLAVTPIGADVLEFSATGGGGVLDVTAGEAFAASPATTGGLPLDTSNWGAVPGSITFTSDNQAVQNGTIVRNVNGTVVRPSQPSFSGDDVVQTATVDWPLDPDTGVQFIDVLIYNYAFDSFQARLDLDALSGLEEPFGYVSGLTSNVGATPATLRFSFDTEGLNDGVYAAPLTIHTSDENLPGETFVDLALTLLVALGDASPCRADLNSDGAVDVLDLLILLDAWGPCPRGRSVGGCPADLNGDGVVDVLDLLILLDEWGPC